jgi:hypothetical protein
MLLMHIMCATDELQRPSRKQIGLVIASIVVYIKHAVIETLYKQVVAKKHHCLMSRTRCLDITMPGNEAESCGGIATLGMCHHDFRGLLM